MDALQYAFTTSGLQQPTRWVPAGVLNGQGVYQSAHQNTAPGAPGAQIPRSQQVGPLMVAQQAQQTQHHMVHQQAPTQPIQMMQNGHMFKAGMKTQLPSNVQLINGRIVASAGLQQGGNGIPMHNLAIQQLAAPAPVYSRLPPANVINSNGLQMARMVSASTGLGAVQAGPSQMMQPIQTVRVPQLGQGNMRAGELGGGQMLSLQQQQLQQHQVAQLLQQQVHQQNQAAQQQLQLQQIAQQQQLEQQHKAQQRKVFQQQLQQQQLAQQYQASINTAQARQQLLTLQAHMNTMQAVQAGSSANATNQIQRQANSGMVYGTATNAQGQLINVRVLNSAQVGTGQLMEMQQVQGMRHVVRGHITPQQQQQQNVAAANQLLLLQAHARQQQLVAAGTQQARPVMIQQQVAAGSQGQAQGQAQGQGPFMLVSKASACSSLDNVSPHSWPQNATRMDPACNWPSMQKPGSRQQSMQLQGGLVMGGAVPVAGSLNNLVQTNSQQAMQGVPVARQLLTGVTGVSGGSGVDLQAIVSSIGVELAKHGIPVASALEAGWLGVLGENDVALLQEAYTAEISRLARVGAAPSASVYSACSDTPHMSHSPAGSGSVSSAASIPPVNGAPAPVMRQQSRGDLSTFAPHTFFGHMGEDEDGLLGELEADADDDDMSSAALADAMTDSVVGSVKHNELSGSLLKDGLAAHWGVGGLSWWSGSNSVANISDPQPWSLTAQFGLKTEAQEMENSEGAAGHSDPNRSDSDPLGSHTELAARLANLDLGCGFF